MSPATSSSFPRRFIEHWIQEPEMLRRFALHYKTGEPMPEALIGQASRRAPVQSGLGDGRIHRLGAGRPEAPSRSVARRGRRGRVRAAGAQADRHAGRDRHASPHAAFPAYFLGRLFGRLLQLSVVGSSRRRRLRGVRGDAATSSTPTWRGGSRISSMRPAAAATMTRPIEPFAAAAPSPGGAVPQAGARAHGRRRSGVYVTRLTSWRRPRAC